MARRNFGNEAHCSRKPKEILLETSTTIKSRYESSGIRKNTTIARRRIKLEAVVQINSHCDRVRLTKTNL
jgi:hypothetical protein